MNMLGFRFVPKTPEVVEIRRASTDKHANIAQASQITLFLCVPFFRLKIRKSAKYTDFWHDARPNKQDGRSSGWLRSISYWTEGKFVIGMLWLMWLLFLCFIQTHQDAYHLIQRLGLVAASQLPVHILLSTKNIVPPLGFLIQNSNRWNMTIHRIGGRIIINFFGLHSLGYTTISVQHQMFRSMAHQPQIIVAILSSVIFFIALTSSRAFRLRWHSLFRKIHYVGSVTALHLLFIHNGRIKMYIIESLVAFFLKKIAETAAFATSSP